MLDFLRDPIWQFLGALIAFFGILVTVYLAFLRKVKRPTFVTSDTLLQTAAHPEITIQFRGRKIANLNRLYLLFWNSGNEEIRATDIPRAGGPCIEFLEGAGILSYAVKSTSSEGINFTVAQESNRLMRLNFEYLNPGDGGVVEIYYEATETKKPVPMKLAAFIIGATPVRTIEYRSPLRGARVIVMSCMGMVFVAMGLLSILAGAVTQGNSQGLLGLGYLTLGVVTLGTILWDRSTNRVPDFAKPYFQ